MDAGDLFSSWVERAVGVGADADADADAEVRRPSRRWRRVVARDMRMSCFLFFPWLRGGLSCDRVVG